MTVRDRWRWTDERGVQRLVTTEELRKALLDGTLPATTLVWREGMKEWVVASSVAELRTLEVTSPSASPSLDPKLPKPPVRRSTLRGVSGDAGEPAPPKSVPVKVPAVGDRPRTGTVTQVPPYGAPPDGDTTEPTIPAAPRPPRAFGGGDKTLGGVGPDRDVARQAGGSLGSRVAASAGRSASQGQADSKAPVAERKPHPRPPLRTTTLTGLSEQEAQPPPAATSSADFTPVSSSDLIPIEDPAPAQLGEAPPALAEAKPASPSAPGIEAPVASPTVQVPAPNPLPPQGASSAPTSNPPAPVGVAERPSSRPPPDALSVQASRPRSQSSRPPSPSRRRGLHAQVAVPLSSLLGAGAAVIGVAVSSFFIGRSTTAGVALTAHPTLRVLPALSRASLPSTGTPKPCWVSKQPARWAAEASKTIPFDVVSTREGGVLVGYARDEKEAMGIHVDLATGQAQSRFHQQGTEDIEHVTPRPTGEFDVLRSSAAGDLRTAVEVAGDLPFAVGVAVGGVAIASPRTAAPQLLWHLEGEDALGSPVVEPVPPKGHALVFRRAGAVWAGMIGPDRKASSELVKVAGSGGTVGKPAASFNGRELVVIFADRPSTDKPYEIRMGRAPSGSAPQNTQVMPLPGGGPGGDAFAPNITGLPDGRWILVWTEGPAGSRAIRAQTLAPDLSPLGDPIALSPPAGNFGQGVAAIAGTHAVTVFLSKGSTNYELWGAVLQCG